MPARICDAARRSQQAIHCSFFSTHPSGRMKPREYCCCAIPVINFGIYFTLTEQFVLGILAGTLSVATPGSNYAPILPSSLLRPLFPVVGAATPSFARWIFAAICYVGAMVQVLGFVGVAKACIFLPSTHLVAHFWRTQEKPILFRRYVSLHALITIAAFAVAAVWIAISASRHSTAKNNCEQRFFSTSSDLTSEGETMCEIFPWVDVGLMGALWAVLLISQVRYLFEVDWVPPDSIRFSSTSIPSFPDMAQASAGTMRNSTPYIPWLASTVTSPCRIVLIPGKREWILRLETGANMVTRE